MMPLLIPYQVTCKIQGISLAFYKYNRLEPLAGHRLYKETKNILNMNKEIGMLLSKKELLCTSEVGKSNNYYNHTYTF